MKHESKEQIRQEIAAIQDKLNYLLNLLDEDVDDEVLSGNNITEIKEEDIPVVEVQIASIKVSK